MGEWRSETGVVLEFHTRLDEIDVNGVDMITFDRTRALITAFKVMIRPLKAINIVQSMMAARLYILMKLKSDGLHVQRASSNEGC